VRLREHRARNTWEIKMDGTITVYRGKAYSESIATASAPEGYTKARVTWAWRNYTSGHDWQIQKSYTIADGAITSTLDAYETAHLPFGERGADHDTVGYCTVDYLHPTTGATSLCARYYASVIETGTAPDSSAGSMRYAITFNRIGTLVDGETLPSASAAFDVDVVITGIAAAVGKAPAGQAIQFEIYIDDVGSSQTLDVDAAASSNSGTLDYAASAGTVPTIVANQVGTTPNEGADAQVTIYYVRAV